MGMVYRRLLIGNKKDDLESVWEAAHFPKRIKRDLVDKTNITSSVDKIMVEQLPVVTYRILGFLLLGVTRIYSKKVEYLLIDCNHSLNELKFFYEGRKKVGINVGGMCLPESSSHRSKSKAVELPVSESSSKKRCNNTFVEAMRAQFSSITMPENFDLDAFDLEIVENESSDDHVRPHLELVLHDPWENDRTGRRTSCKGRVDVSTRFSDHASTSTSAMITNTNRVNSETSAEKFRHGFSLDECLDPMVLGETDEEMDLAVIPFIEQEPEGSNINSSDMISANGENLDTTPHEECTTGQTVVSEMTSVDITRLEPSPNKRQLSVTINVTPQSKAPAVVSDEQKSDFVAVRTPASREHARPPRKRICVSDDPIKVPRELYKNWLENASDLIRKKRVLTASFARKERLSSDCFLKPILPSLFPDLRPAISTNELLMEEVEETNEAGPVNEEVEPLMMDKVSESREAEAIAPSTPVTRSKASEMGPASSSESREKDCFPIRNLELDEIQTEEGPSSMGKDDQENVVEKWSSITKSVGGYLHKNFMHRKEKGEEEAVNLSQILKHKTKQESARFFSQILVLKTGGYIDVKQEKPYDDIGVMETQKLKEVFGAGS